MDGQSQAGCLSYGYINTKHQTTTDQHSICPRSEKQKFMQPCLFEFLRFSSFARFVLPRISWTLLHWLLSLAVISELYCLPREFFNVLKILFIICHSKVKDVVYVMNCYPLFKWEWSASLVLRKGACLALKRCKMRLQDRVSLDPMISRQRMRRDCIYLEKNIKKSAFIYSLQWIADRVDLAPELMINT